MMMMMAIEIMRMHLTSSMIDNMVDNNYDVYYHHVVNDDAEKSWLQLKQSMVMDSK